MHLIDILSEETIALHLKGLSKKEIIIELVNVLYSTGKIKDKALALECILEREKTESTGMRYGVAIPHGKTDSVSEFIACVGISDNPVHFDSLDGEPCQIFIMTLAPPHQTSQHLQFLAAISTLLKSPEKRNLLLNANNVEDALKIFKENNQ